MKEKFLLILFYSASGSVRNLAHAIADGAEEYDLKVKLRTVPKISKDNKSINHDINKL
jgi:NAD(P)H dehydrogenase (quinone)